METAEQQHVQTAAKIKTVGYNARKMETVEWRLMVTMMWQTGECAVQSSNIRKCGRNTTAAKWRLGSSQMMTGVKIVHFFVVFFFAFV